MNDDAALLRSYAEKGSESAFTALVQRHLDLVYAAALRRVGGDAHLAADVAQQVFITLARQAGRLAHVNVLGAWLHTATRNAAVDLVISEQRRQAREQTSLDPALTPDASAPEWERLKPVLDAAIDELAAPDREAVVLRFLEQKPFAEIGAALKVSSDAARMRTERALDKLRATLERRGITSTAAAVGGIISSQPLIAAPAGLAGSIAASAVATAGAGAGVLTVTFASLMKLKTIVTGVAILFAFGAGTYVGLMQQLDTPPLPAPETPRHSQTIAELRKENLSLRVEVEQLKMANTNRSAPVPAPRPASVAAAQPTGQFSPAQITAQIRDMVSLQKAKAMQNNLRQLAAVRDRYALEHGRPATSIAELIGPNSKYIKDFKPVDGESYASISLLPSERAMSVTSPNGLTVGLDSDGKPLPLPGPSSPEFETGGLAAAMQKAHRAYQAANHGARIAQTESGTKALLPYFATPQDAADFVEFTEAMKQAGLLPP